MKHTTNNRQRKYIFGFNLKFPIDVGIVWPEEEMFGSEKLNT